MRERTRELLDSVSVATESIPMDEEQKALKERLQAEMVKRMGRRLTTIAIVRGSAVTMTEDNTPGNIWKDINLLARHRGIEGAEFSKYHVPDMAYLHTSDQRVTVGLKGIVGYGHKGGDTTVTGIVSFLKIAGPEQVLSVQITPRALAGRVQVAEGGTLRGLSTEELLQMDSLTRDMAEAYVDQPYSRFTIV